MTNVMVKQSSGPEFSLAQGTRRTWVLPFLIAGSACVIIGGLLAAATAYSTTEKTAWATAYIVLVGGAAQVCLGAAVAWLAPHASRRLAWWSLIGWNVGNAGVLAGQLAGLIVLTDIGTGILIVALILVLVAAGGWGRSRTAPSGVRAAGPGGAVGAGTAAPIGDAGSDRSVGEASDVTAGNPHPGILWTFRGLVILLAVTMPTGVIIAYLSK